MLLFSSSVSPLTREYLNLEIQTNNSIEQKRRLLYFYKLSPTPRMYRIARLSVGWPKAIAHWCIYCLDFKSFFFTHSYQFSRKEFQEFFTHYITIFTYVIFQKFSRGTLNIFSRRASHFHGQKTIFFHAQQTIFHVGKKKHCLNLHRTKRLH